MPVIKDKMESSAEIAKKTINGGGLLLNVGYTGKPSDEGRVTTTKGSKIDKTRVEETINDVLENKEHPLFVSSSREL